MQIVFLFYDGMTALDAVGPHEVLSRLPNTKTLRCARHAGPVHIECGLVMNAEFSISDVTHADVLVVPGGGRASTLREYPEMLEWIRAMHANSTWTTSVCTGSLILGAAGILKGVEATTHWSTFERLRSWGAIPKHERVVESGKVITAAGVSAGIDMALLLAAKIAGMPVAQALQLGIEYDPKPPFDFGSPKKVPPAVLEAVRARLESAFEKA